MLTLRPPCRSPPEQVDKLVETVKQREGFYDPHGTSEILK
jgi:hypothetical protein